MGSIVSSKNNISSCKNIIASCSEDGEIRLWNINSTIPNKILMGHLGSVLTIAKLCSNKLVSSGVDSSLKIWDYNSGALLNSFNHPNGLIINAILVLDEFRIITSNSQFELELWDLKKKSIAKTLVGHKGLVNKLALLNENIILSGSADKTVKLWNLETKKTETYTGFIDEIQSIVPLRGQVNKINSIPTKKLSNNLVTSKKDEITTTTRFNTESCYDTTSCIKDKNINIASNCTYRILIFLNQECIKTIKRQDHSFNAMIQINEKELLVASTCYFLIYNISKGLLTKKVVADNIPNFSVISLFETYVLCADPHYNYFCLIDYSNGKYIKEYKGHREKINNVELL